MTAYYNEVDPFASEWLRSLERGGRIASGSVDGRSIRRVRPEQVAAATQAHFFAGIGGWSYALRLAGWPDDAPVWTGSCPCQPFSEAGAKRGTDDPRHLWPEWFRLIRECRPPIIFGEQVASADGLAWFDDVSADLESAGYAVGAADLCAAGIGAPHRRQRLYFVAYAPGARWAREPRGEQRVGRVDLGVGHKRTMADANGGTGSRAPGLQRGVSHGNDSVRCGEDGDGTVGDSGGDRDREHARELSSDEGEHGERREDGDHPSESPSAARDFWTDCEWLPCSDGRARPVEPGLKPLVHGVPNRVGKLRGFGNAIVPQLAAEFIRASMEAIGEQ